MPRALISLGSNLGDRRANLALAVRSLAATPGVRLLRRSAWHATAPAGGPTGQGEFLNGAAVVETNLPPAELLAELQQIEQSAQRRREVRWGPRSLDLDLLLHDASVIDSPALTLPHPRMTCRRFVLSPAAEIAGAMLHPASGWTVAALRRQLDVSRRVAIAGADAALLAELAVAARGDVVAWEGGATGHFPANLAVLLAVWPAGDPSESAARTRLDLPARGPVGWFNPDDTLGLVELGQAAIAAAL